MGPDGAPTYERKQDGHPHDHYAGDIQGAQQIMVWAGLTRQGVVLGPHFTRANLDLGEYMRIIRYNVSQREFPMSKFNRPFFVDF